MGVNPYSNTFRTCGKGGETLSNTDRQVRRYNDFLSQILPGFGEYDPTNKKEISQSIIKYMLNRTITMFKWNNLPDTIPERMLEIYLQVNAHCAFYKYKGDLFVYTGGFGGEPDAYYRPTLYTIANPAQKLSVNATINKDCIVMLNDSYIMGLLPLCKRYASSMTETEISMYTANINSRIISLISAQDDRTRKSAEKYISDIIEGKLSIVGETKFFEDLKATPFSTSGAHAIITDLIELMQYNKASWFNEVGLNANYNMKRESINADESQLNNDALSPLVDDMLNNRKLYAEKVNAMFGTNITVDLASSWKENEIEHEKELENMEKGENENEENEINPPD